MTFYRNIIKDAWNFSWHYKYLWFFGLFAALLGNGGEYEIFFKSITGEKESGIISFFQRILDTGLFSKEGLNSISARLWERPSVALMMIVIVTLTIACFVLVIWLINISQIVIVSAAAREEREKKHTFQQGMQKGMKEFWPIFVLNIFAKLFIISALAIVAYFSSTLWLVLSFIIIIPLATAVLFIIKYSIAYIIIRKEELPRAIYLAWNLFKKNWLISLELAFLLYLFSLGAGIIFIILFFNIEKFFEVLSYGLLSGFSMLSFWLYTTIQPLVLFALLSFVGSILAIFQTTSWTKLFLELEGRGAKSKLERVFER